MKLVSDPNLISTLESAPVTDPALLAQLEGGSSQSPNASSSSNNTYFPGIRMLQDVMAGGSAFGQGIHNAPYYLQKMQENIGLAPKGTADALMPKPTNLDTSSLFGVQNPGILDKALQGATQYLPAALMGNPSLLGQAIPGALFGATQSSNPLTGAAIGAAVPLGLKGAGVVGGGLKELGNIIGGTKAFQYFSPKKVADSILGDMSGGKSLAENAQSIATDIKSSFDSAKENASAIYKPIFDNYRNSDIYSGIDSPEAYKSLPEKVTNKYMANIEDLHDNFIGNPTLDNAHDLQSQLGYEIRSLEKAKANGVLDKDGSNALYSYSKARNALKDDIGSFLDTKDNTGIMSKLFDHSAENYAENVAPYLSNPAISKIASGAITNTKKIMGSIPSILSSENIAKIGEDIGGNFHNKLIYSEIGKVGGDPKSLSEALSEINMDKKGLTPFVSDDLKAQLSNLSSALSRKKFIQKAAGIGALSAVPFGIHEVIGKL